jgi:iron-sulfur cluster insertion protein
MTLDPSAITKIQEILAEENNPAMKLRVFVQGGGCSGFQQGFSLEETAEDDDFLLEFSGVTVLIDSMSWEYLKNSTINFVEDITGSSFIISNPDSTGSCGCGSSFSM